VISVPSSTDDRVLAAGSASEHANTDKTYKANAITYTSNPEECAAAYTDSFDYKVVDSVSGGSKVSTIN